MKAKPSALTKTKYKKLKDLAKTLSHESGEPYQITLERLIQEEGFKHSNYVHKKAKHKPSYCAHVLSYYLHEVFETLFSKENYDIFFSPGASAVLPKETSTKLARKPLIDDAIEKHRAIALGGGVQLKAMGLPWIYRGEGLMLDTLCLQASEVWTKDSNKAKIQATFWIALQDFFNSVYQQHHDRPAVRTPWNTEGIQSEHPNFTTYLAHWLFAMQHRKTGLDLIEMRTIEMLSHEFPLEGECRILSQGSTFNSKRTAVR